MAVNDPNIGSYAYSLFREVEDFDDFTVAFDKIIASQGHRTNNVDNKVLKMCHEWLFMLTRKPVTFSCA